jgi:hypothetical protein
VNLSIARNSISPLQDLAADLLGDSVRLGHPAWAAAPMAPHPDFFPTWQAVSLALQKALRHWIPELAYRDLSRYHDRDDAYAMIVYEAGRICQGRQRTEFTYDVADAITLEAATRLSGHSTQIVLQRIEQRLDAAGDHQFARRYSPVWSQDILRAVRHKPRRLLALIAKDARLVNAVIDLGTARTPTAARRFVYVTSTALRSLNRVDMRELIPRLLTEATRVLTEKSAGREDHLIDAGLLQHHNAVAARPPDSRIARNEDRDDRRPDRRRQVRDTAVVADVDSRPGNPAGHVVQVFEARRVFESLLGPGAPAHRHAQVFGDGAEILQRPALGEAAREGMDDREIFPRCGRDFDPRNSF